MNRLAQETSPYLLQHAHNPVDWYPWGEEALTRARVEDKPILLSVGYSACHWCHVMERESFENEDIARLMNEHYVCIKVDREERPDVDAVYMTAVQSLTGHGGWPMTVFLTPDGRPFWGGTYFPPEDRQGMPGFPRVLTALAQTYREQRDQIESRAGQITEHLRNARDFRAPGDLVPELLDHAARALGQSFDQQNGGFGGAPKFPAAMALDFLLRYWRRTGQDNALHLVQFTLGKMARGGIYDHLGGGFHRYAVDAIWLVPHFEKMLYDNALLARVYLHAWQATGDSGYRRIVEETLDYVLREMTDPAGGFYSTQDADSEGVEGKFFVWTPAEIEAVIGTDGARLFNAYYGVTEHGNFEHKNILNVTRDLRVVAAEQDVDIERLRASLADSRRRLFDAREQRIHPGRDDKVLTAWNGMLLRALAEAAAVLGREDYHVAAVRNAEFLTSAMMRDGRVLRSWKAGEAKIDGYLEDYALLIDGLLGVHELTFDAGRLEQARALADQMLDLFWDEEIAGFYDTARDAEALIVRPRDVLDNATPSGNSVAVSVLLRLGLLLGNEEYVRRATTVLGSLREAMTRYPSAFGELLGALDFQLGAPLEFAVVGPPADPGTRALLAEVYRRYLPNKVVAGRAPEDETLTSMSPLMEGRGQINGLATAYLCQQYTCLRPVDSPADLALQIDRSRNTRE
jgi:uncharacterized protein